MKVQTLLIRLASFVLLVLLLFPMMPLSALAIPSSEGAEAALARSSEAEVGAVDDVANEGHSFTVSRLTDSDRQEGSAATGRDTPMPSTPPETLAGVSWAPLLQPDPLPDRGYIGLIAWYYDIVGTNNPWPIDYDSLVAVEAVDPYTESITFHRSCYNEGDCRLHPSLEEGN